VPAVEEAQNEAGLAPPSSDGVLGCVAVLTTAAALLREEIISLNIVHVVACVV
jgi:hypothetical protein